MRILKLLRDRENFSHRNHEIKCVFEKGALPLPPTGFGRHGEVLLLPEENSRTARAMYS
jgi:hypothetical protein